MAEIKEKDFINLTTKELFKLMAGPSQIKRKNAAKVLYERVKENPEKFKAQIPQFVDALSRPEAQTRWISLDALALLVPVDAKACKAAVEGAEEALFDERTALIRESAVRFLSRYGASSVQRSKEVWPILKDGLQQFHGEIDYDRILKRITVFAGGNLDANVKKDFRKVTKEISNSVGGATKERLNRILLLLSGKQISHAPQPKREEKKPEPKKKAPAKKAEDKKKPAAKKQAAKKTSVKKPAAKKPVAKKPVAKKASAKKPSVAKKVDAKKKEVKKQVVKKAVKTAVAKPKAKTAVGKKVEQEKKKVAKKVVKKAVKQTVKDKVKAAVKKAVRKK